MLLTARSGHFRLTRAGAAYASRPLSSYRLQRIHPDCHLSGFSAKLTISSFNGDLTLGGLPCPAKGCRRAGSWNARVSARDVHPLTVRAS